ncbi:MAG: Stage II sporulation protein P [Firmicutes bacterium]|nr:Stage II sporulation protein P [Bacillota bacterium]MDI6704779.1 stage II sporulation protein P [Bacillota bacterium]
MIKFKTIKPGKWIYVVSIIFAVLAVFLLFRSLLFAYSSVEVFSVDTALSSPSEDNNERMNTILKTALEKAFPLMAVMNAGGGGVSIFQGIVEIFTRLDYRDPKSFIMAELPIMRSYDIPIASRGEGKGLEPGTPYDPEEELDEILKQFDLGQVNLEPVTAGSLQQASTEFGKPDKTKLDMNMPMVLIYHTHTSEAYKPSSKFNYTPTDVDRTIDPRYSVVRIGKELKEELEGKHNIKVVHVTTFHDYPEYSTSYARSLSTVKNALATYPSIKVILDIHRDAFPVRNKAEETYARNESTMKVGNADTARLMLVWGPDAENSKETRKFAELLKNKINEQVPGLCRKVLEKSIGKYNQHLSNYSALIEVGSNSNTMEEALNSVPYLAKAIAAAIKEIGE